MDVSKMITGKLRKMVRNQSAMLMNKTGLDTKKPKIKVKPFKLKSSRSISVKAEVVAPVKNAASVKAKPCEWQVLGLQTK